MKLKNLKLLSALWAKRMTQYELVKRANLSSEARLSRIVNYAAMPQPEEIERMAAILEVAPNALGFKLQPIHTEGAANVKNN